MSSNNFINGLQALISTVRLSLYTLLSSNVLIGFLGGMIITTLVILFILTKDPRRIPLILRFSAADSFQRIAKKNKNGTYQLAFINFVKIYSQVRILSLVSFIAFCTMITTITLIAP